MKERPLLCDTDILSEITKAIDVRVVRRSEAYIDHHGELAFASVTVMEVLHGLYRKGAYAQASKALEVFAKSREIVPKKKDCRLSAEILGALDRQGTPIGKIDPLIAACALNRGLDLATGNTRHFAYIQDAGFPLRLEDRRAP